MLPSLIRRTTLLLGAAAFASTVTPNGAHAVSTPTNFIDEVVVEGYASPTGFAFLPDGRILVTEQRTGNVRMAVNGSATPPILTVPLLNSIDYERGLLSIAVDRGWPQRPFVYLFYTRTGSFLRLVRYTAIGDLSAALSTNLALIDPYLVMDDLADIENYHNGGALRFDDDGYLYLSLGEDGSPCSAQSPGFLRGVIIRLDVDGLPLGPGGPATRDQITPADNPFVQSEDEDERLVWAYGLRNPFRFGIDPVTGKIYLGDVGESSWEEVDEIERGDNLGWPHYEGFQGSEAGCPPPTGFNPRAPIAAYNHGVGVAVMGAGVYRPRAGGTANWPVAYWGDVFYADYYTGIFRRLSWNGSAWGPEFASGQPTASDWANGLSSPVDFQVGPDGSFWWASQTGEIHRIRYTGSNVSVDDATPRLGTLTAVSPFSGGTDLAFAIERGGRVRVAVFDVRGRRVRSLLDESLGPGARQMHWDGNDEEGRAVPSGMYLIRLDHPGGTAVARALRLR